MSKKILIFGATGGIGSILINNLKNYEIKIRNIFSSSPSSEI